MESNDYIMDTKDNPQPPAPSITFHPQTIGNINTSYIPNSNQTKDIQVAIYNNKNKNENIYNNNINNYIVQQNQHNNEIINSNDVYNKREDLNASNSSFQINFFIHHDITSKFLMKVYGIVLFEFIIIFGLVFIFQINSVKKYLQENTGFYWAFFGTFLVILVLLTVFYSCETSIFRKVPINYIVLFVSAFALAFLCAFLASFYNFEVVLAAVTCVISICIGSFCLGLFNKGGDVKFYHFFITSLICLIVHYAILAIIYKRYYLLFLYDTIVALFYSFFIAFDTIAIKEFLSIDEYIYAAFILTIDIIRLFIILLQIFSNSSGNKK